jgi:hypothetical protein
MDASMGSGQRSAESSKVMVCSAHPTRLRNTLPDFLADPDTASTFVKFLQDRIDLSRAEGTRLVA